MKRLAAVVVCLAICLIFVTGLAEIRRTPDGGYVLAGSTSSYGAGSRDIWVVRTSKDGDILWQNAYGTDSWESLRGLTGTIDFTDDGGYVLVGSVSSSRPDSPSSEVGSLVVRLDSEGNIVWQKMLEREGHVCRLSSIQSTENGGFIAAGYIGSIPPDDSVKADTDAWVVGLSNDGSLKWERSYGGNLPDGARHVIQTDDGGYLFVGETTMPSGQVSAGELWVVKLATDGSVSWGKSYGEPMELEPGQFGAEIGYMAFEESDKGYTVIGTTRSFGVGGGARGDIWIIELDPQGGVRWEKAYGGVCLETPPVAIRLSSGGYLLGTNTNSFDPREEVVVDRDSCGKQGIHNIWLVAIDEAGKIIWQKVYGDNGVNGIGGLAKTGGGNYLLRALISGRSRIIELGKGGDLLEGVDSIKFARTDVSALRTRSNPKNSGVSVGVPDTMISNGRLKATPTEVSEIFSSDG